MKQRLNTLGDLALMEGGAVRMWFDRELATILDDLLDRPSLKKDRELTVKVLFQPVPDDSGALAYVVHKVSVGSKVPGHATRSIAGRRSKEGLVWDDLSPKDPDQLTIDDEMGRKKEAKDFE